MIIDKDKRFIFVHIPRTGGSSMTHVLSHLNDKPITDFIQKNYEYYFRVHHGQAHKNHHTHATMAWLSPFDYNDYGDVFCFVRNPWERLRSVYIKMHQSMLHDLHINHVEYIDGEGYYKHGVKINLPDALASFSNFIDNVHKENTSHRCPSTAFKIHEIVSQPQSHWYQHPAITTVYKFENYQENVKSILDKYDVINTDNFVLPHINKTGYKYPYEYDLTYTSEMIEKVAYIESDTINEFDYSFKSKEKKCLNQ